MARRGALVVLVLVSLAGAVAPVGVGKAAGLTLPSTPQATSCVGAASLSRPDPSVGNSVSMNAGMACGGHSITASGVAVPTTLEDICADAVVSLTFESHESVDYGSPSPSTTTWTFQGHNGVFAVTTKNAETGTARVGTMETAVGGCYGGGAGGTLVFAQAGQGAAAVPDVLLCHATLSVTPDSYYGGRGGYEYAGPANGTGSCRSSRGGWDAVLDGQWDASSDLQTCYPPRYDLSLRLTSPSATMSIAQGWDGLMAPAPQLKAVGAGPLSYTGAGVVTGEEDACTAELQAPFTVTADWAFIVS